MLRYFSRASTKAEGMKMSSVLVTCQKREFCAFQHFKNLHEEVRVAGGERGARVLNACCTYTSISVLNV